MDVYAHEKEQIEEIKAWWRENRWFIIAGLALSVAIVGGWRLWQEYQQEQAQAASLQYDRMLTKAAAGDAKSLEATVLELQQEYSSTPYAALGSLKLAAEFAGAGNYEAAVAPLRWAMDNTDDDELALVARSRLARVLLQLERYDDALEVLRGVEAGKFTALFAELRGDALLVKGDRDGARAAYEEALAGMEPGLGERSLVQMKIDNLQMPVLGEPAATPRSGEE